MALAEEGLAKSFFRLRVQGLENASVRELEGSSRWYKGLLGALVCLGSWRCSAVFQNRDICERKKQNILKESKYVCMCVCVGGCVVDSVCTW